MIDFITLGPVPADETYQQVGSPQYDPMKSRKECRVFKEQLERLFPDCSFGVKGFNHDFNVHYEVVIYYDDEKSAERAYEVEAKCPDTWDDVALSQLNKDN